MSIDVDAAPRRLQMQSLALPIPSRKHGQRVVRDGCAAFPRVECVMALITLPLASCYQGTKAGLHVAAPCTLLAGMVVHLHCRWHAVVAGEPAGK